mmetsp:Transcript_2374/g.5127  ORF Transcript_2374/g.5127 Transcript_2374/m.5127 type:complete len:254 (+) Transcript_2374:356-1117(+)
MVVAALSRSDTVGSCRWTSIHYVWDRADAVGILSIVVEWIEICIRRCKVTSRGSSSCSWLGRKRRGRIAERPEIEQIHGGRRRRRGSEGRRSTLLGRRRLRRRDGMTRSVIGVQRRDGSDALVRPLPVAIRGGLPVIPLVLVRLHHEPFEDVNIVPLPRSSAGSDGGSVRQPHPPRVIVPVNLQLEHLALVPRAHRERFASMRHGLVGGLAGVAHEGEVLDADGGEAVLGGGAAVGAYAVGGEASQLLHGGFG